MKTFAAFLTLTLSTIALSLAGVTPVRADTRGEIEAARMNAKAGGPTNDRDAELLRRWGCYSDTNSPFCQRLRERDQGAYSEKPRRPKY
jgi:hypothetical protein